MMQIQSRHASESFIFIGFVSTLDVGMQVLAEVFKGLQ